MNALGCLKKPSGKWLEEIASRELRNDVLSTNADLFHGVCFICWSSKRRPYTLRSHRFRPVRHAEPKHQFVQSHQHPGVRALWAGSRAKRVLYSNVDRRVCID